MITTFYCQAWALIKSDLQNNLSCFLVVFNWIHLGLFTGSCGAEYCQTMAQHHEVSWVPNDGVVGSYAGKLIAFIMTDFWFLTSDETLVLPLNGLAHPLQVVELQICFQYNKSPINGRWQKFWCTGHGYLCPVLAGLSIVQWAIALQVPNSNPLGVYMWMQDNKSFHTYTYLQSTKLITIMQHLIVTAHPELLPLSQATQPPMLHWLPLQLCHGVCRSEWGKCILGPYCT